MKSCPTPVLRCGKPGIRSLRATVSIKTAPMRYVVVAAKPREAKETQTGIKFFKLNNFMRRLDVDSGTCPVSL